MTPMRFVFWVLVVFRHCSVGEAAETWIETNDRGKRLFEEGRCRESVPLLMRARALAASAPDANEAAATSASNLGAAYLCLGQYSRAEQTFREALEALRSGRLPELRLAIANNLGVLLTRVASWREAKEVLAEGLSLAEAAFGANHWMTATAAHSLGVLWLQSGDYGKACDLFRRALAIFEEVMAEHVYTATALSNLGVAKMYLREYNDAVVHTGRALELRRKLLPAKHPDLGVSLYNHAVALEKSGNRRLSKAAFREARSISTSFAAENLTGVTVDKKVLERKVQGRAIR